MYNNPQPWNRPQLQDNTEIAAGFKLSTLPTLIVLLFSVCYFHRNRLAGNHFQNQATFRAQYRIMDCQQLSRIVRRILRGPNTTGIQRPAWYSIADQFPSPR